MFGPIPLADQDGARFELAHRRELDRFACAGLVGHALQQPAGGGDIDPPGPVLNYKRV